MSDILVDGGVEIGAGWTFNTYAQQDALAARTGSYGGSVTRNLSPASAGIAQSPNASEALVVGQEYTWTGWFKWASGGDTQELTVQLLDSIDGAIASFRLNKDAGTIYRSIPSPVGTVSSGHDFTDWVELSHTFTATTSGIATVDIRNRIANPKVTATWYFDDLALDTDTMAVKLAELAVGAIATHLAAELETELAAIDTNRADSITTAGTTTSYYQHPKDVIAGGETHIEIFESAFEFTNPFSDAYESRAIYALPVTVRVTFFNRNADTEGNFVTRARRLVTGVFNAINKAPTLSDVDTAIQIVSIRAVAPEWESEGESREITKARVTLFLNVACHEVQ